MTVTCMYCLYCSTIQDSAPTHVCMYVRTYIHTVATFNMEACKCLLAG